MALDTANLARSVAGFLRELADSVHPDAAVDSTPTRTAPVASTPAAAAQRSTSTSSSASSQSRRGVDVQATIRVFGEPADVLSRFQEYCRDEGSDWRDPQVLGTYLAHEEAEAEVTRWTVPAYSGYSSR